MILLFSVNHVGTRERGLSCHIGYFSLAFCSRCCSNSSQLLTDVVKLELTAEYMAHLALYYCYAASACIQVDW